jgi:hypothetical protein
MPFSATRVGDVDRFVTLDGDDGLEDPERRLRRSLGRTQPS